MRTATILTLTALAAVLATGCAGPERKLGRGLMNVTEFGRLGEVRRSMEQTALWENPDTTYTTGFIRGFNRSVVRTVLGVYEVATFPIPNGANYDALLTSSSRIYPDPSIKTKNPNWGGLALEESPPYPDSYHPNLISDSTFHTDTSIGFSGGDVLPFIPGSRFRIFDN